MRGFLKMKKSPYLQLSPHPPFYTNGLSRRLILVFETNSGRWLFLRWSWLNFLNSPYGSSDVWSIRCRIPCIGRTTGKNKCISAYIIKIRSRPGIQNIIVPQVIILDQLTEFSREAAMNIEKHYQTGIDLV